MPHPTTTRSAHRPSVCRAPLPLALLLLLALGAASAQFAERGSLIGSGNPDVDASGRSVKNPRVRAVHTDDVTLQGGTAHLIHKDPFLAYQLGRNLNFREFRHRDGALLANVAGLGGPMVDPTVAKITTNNHTSCLGCHNAPNGNPGGGSNFSKDSGFGRNTPHYYGAGIMEMLAIQNRQRILDVVDTDGDGWVSVAEAQAAPAQTLVTSAPGGAAVDFGSGQLDGGAVGRPQLNNIFRVWYGLETPTPGGGSTIMRAPRATQIDGVTATHYNFEMVVWGWGQRAPPAALNPTNRAFFWDPMATHTNLEAFDPSTTDDPDGDGVSQPTLAGAIQFPATHVAPDPGINLNPLGFSEDDPDGDGHLTEISEGDLDLAEWFMLNAPRPAFAGDASDYDRGVVLMNQLGCTSCHVPQWRITAADDTYAGDRRFFDFDVTWTGSPGGGLGGAPQFPGSSSDAGNLRGELIPLFDVVGDTYVPRRDAFVVNDLFTDFRQHDMGPGFVEQAFDGNENRVWRTPPLWGVGSGFPWGHDGRSLTLDHVIRRHGGEAQTSADAYAALGEGRRQQLIQFLERLVLYDIESLPADVDGDGGVSSGYVVQGVDTGVERFNAEWLFRTPVQIQGMVLNSDGVLVRSSAAVNLTDAYGLDLPYRLDTDLDGWPDVWDVAPTVPGYKDGLND